MIVLEDKKDLKYHLDKLDKSKKVGAIDIAGPIHEGHSFIIGKCKEIVDVLVVIYVAWNYPSGSFYRTGILDENVPYTFDQVKESILNSEETTKNIDFLVYSPLTESIKKETIENNKNRDKCYNFCKDLGVETLFNQVLLSPIYLEELNDLNYFTGPKNILIDLISRKLLNSDKVYKPTYIWCTYRNKMTSSVLSRTNNSVILGLIIKELYDELVNRDYLDIKFIDIIKKKYSYVNCLNICIIDINTLEKLNKTNNNCIIVCNNQNCFEYIFVRDNKIIFY